LVRYERRIFGIDVSAKKMAEKWLEMILKTL